MSTRDLLQRKILRALTKPSTFEDLIVAVLPWEEDDDVISDALRELIERNAVVLHVRRTAKSESETGS